MHAFFASIEWHAGATVWRVLPAVVVVSGLAVWARVLLRRLRRSLRRGDHR